MTRDIKIRGSIYIDQFFPGEMSIEEAKEKAKEKLHEISNTLIREEIATNNYVGGVAWLNSEMSLAEQAEEIKEL